MGGVSALLLCQAHVFAQDGAVVGVGNGDEGFCLFGGTLIAQVGYSVFRYDGIYVVFRVVDVRTEGNDARDGAPLLCGGASKGREHGVAGVVARTTHAVHHLGAADLRRVNVSVNIHLNCRVEGADAESGNDFGAVGDFRRTNNQAVAEILNVVGEFLQLFRTNG